ncbi:MAG: SgcJ/EcaC family oxidoreductase [Gemmatimonadota bacterium]|nr:SgcJ/EcaC family oxidoreductase [Gemmatimonadota bacterium]
MTHHEESIRALLANYELLLNASDAEGIAELYSANGIFMPQGFPTADGRDAVLATYRTIFNTIALDIEFTVDEIAGGEGIATALTRSNGSVRVNATGAEAPESNRELFVFAQEDGAWRIARYMFNKAG